MGPLSEARFSLGSVLAWIGMGSAVVDIAFHGRLPGTSGGGRQPDRRGVPATGTILGGGTRLLLVTVRRPCALRGTGFALLRRGMVLLRTVPCDQVEIGRAEVVGRLGSILDPVLRLICCPGSCHDWAASYAV
jgi:hypothetical protein